MEPFTIFIILTQRYPEYSAAVNAQRSLWRCLYGRFEEALSVCGIGGQNALGHGGLYVG